MVLASKEIKIIRVKEKHTDQAAADGDWGRKAVAAAHSSASGTVRLHLLRAREEGSDSELGEVSEI
jgi:hypothetical protein